MLVVRLCYNSQGKVPLLRTNGPELHDNIISVIDNRFSEKVMHRRGSSSESDGLGDTSQLQTVSVITHSSIECLELSHARRHFNLNGRQRDEHWSR